MSNALNYISFLLWKVVVMGSKCSYSNDNKVDPFLTGCYGNRLRGFVTHEYKQTLENVVDL
jgi:hypothetical protein